jgi:anti-sigma B factor antagonist
LTNLGIKERRVGSVTILDPADKMRIGLRFGGSSVSLPNAVESLLAHGQTQILLNLEGVDHIDANGLGELVSMHITVNEKGGQIKLVHLTQRLSELMASTKLLAVFDVYENESQAVDSFKSYPVSANGKSAVSPLAS